jgi:uncharacterized membrane protein YczE
MKAKSIAVRYGISTLGLVVIALGVGLSIKSNLGIAPLSCPPTVLNLAWPQWSMGVYTWIFNLSFILLQLAILRKEFKWIMLMQIPAILLFGFLCDGAIWLFNAFDAPATQYGMQILLCLISVVLTAVGIRLEVVGRGWIMSIDYTLAILTNKTRLKYSSWKVIMDVALVALSALFCWIMFGRFTGNDATNAIREGTLILAILTGVCMHFTDPLLEKLFAPVVARSA